MRIRDTGLFIVAFIEVHSICVTVGHLGRYSLTVYHSGELESNNVNRKCTWLTRDVALFFARLCPPGRVSQ